MSDELAGLWKSICCSYSSLITLVRVRLFVRQVALGVDQLDSDIAALAGLLLNERPVIDDILLPQIFGNLREGFEQLDLLRGQEYLSAGLFAQAAQILVVGVFGQARSCAFKVL